jgi:transitional endoplasmic reticulum ATPase
MSLSHPHHGSRDTTITAAFDQSSAPRINTNVVVTRALRQQYPLLDPVVVSEDLLDYARRSHEATYSLLDEHNDAISSSSSSLPESVVVTRYMPAAQRTGQGSLVETLLLGKVAFTWHGEDYLVYVVDGRDGGGYFPPQKFFYILHPDKAKALALAAAAGAWFNELHDEIWLFDSGHWQKSGELYSSIQNASWDNVILDAGMKQALLDDHLSFFRSRERYARYKVPWKRGIIYHGPPGNGKTISIKAMMHTLYSLPDPVPTLYVRSLKSVSSLQSTVGEATR